MQATLLYKERFAAYNVLMKIKEAKAQTVWQLFKTLSDIPRPSKQEEKVCDWLEGLAREQGWVCRKDSVGNIVMEVPASVGYEAAPSVLLQAHTDMVCEKTPESDHDFNNDVIQLVERDGWVYGDQTTLGADNGIGVCMALGVALAKDARHPVLELLFTVDEETGLTGANALEAGFVNAERLINLDSEDEGVFTIGCAGGIRTTIELPVTTGSVSQDLEAYELRVDGLAGGHSGVNINEQRANAIKVMARALEQLRESVSVRLADLSGGNADNAIPRNANVIVLLPKEGIEQAQKILDELTLQLQEEFKPTDPNLDLTLNSAESNDVTQAMDAASSASVIDLLNALPHGVHRYSTEFDGIVETSNNLAKASLNVEKGCLVILTSQRSFKVTCRDELTEQIHAVATLAGAHAKNSLGYPSWQPRNDSELLTVCRKLYQELTGKEPVVEVIHAGLECGIIESKYPGMDMISLGPTIENPHSPEERVNIESVDKVWDFLVELLARLK